MADFSIGIVGLDQTGAALCERFDEVGIGYLPTDMNNMLLQVHLAEGGTAPASTPTDVAQMCDLIFIAETSDEMLRDAVNCSIGLIHGIQPGTIIVDMSDADPRTGQQLAGSLASRGVTWIEATPVGTAEDIREGSMALLTAGPEEAVEKVRPVLESFANRTLRLGELGSGALARALGGAASAMVLALYTELVVIAERIGLDAAGVLQALPLLAPGTQPPPAMIAEEVLRGRFQAGRPLALAERQMDTLLAAAARTHTPAPMAQLARSALAAGHHVENGTGDYADLARAMARQAGVSFGDGEA